CFIYSCDHRPLHSFPTRRSSDLANIILLLAPAARSGRLQFREKIGPFRNKRRERRGLPSSPFWSRSFQDLVRAAPSGNGPFLTRSEEHTSELQSLRHLVCRLLLE